MLANERTLLAYIRTALASLIFGMAAIKFFPDAVPVIILGRFFMAWGIFCLLWGIGRFRRVSRLVRDGIH